MRGDDRSPVGSLTRAGLTCLQPFYRMPVAARNAMFNTGIRKSVHLKRPVISVGNVSTGGTGKTPMVMELIRRIQSMGYRAGVLLRGYKAGVSGSDEAKLYTDEFGEKISVAANPDRVAGARSMLEQGNVDVFLLDDGFQHRQVHRDLDIVLIDATDPVHCARLLPRGFLREPASNMKRADAVIVTHANQVDESSLKQLDDAIASLGGEPPVAHAAHAWVGYYDEKDQYHDLNTLCENKVRGVCGIGNPRPFCGLLSKHIGRDMPVQIMSDHHDYSVEFLKDLFVRIGDDGVDAVVTTEKDWVKWRVLLNGVQTDHVPIYRPALQMEFLDGNERFNDIVATLLRRG